MGLSCVPFLFFPSIAFAENCVITPPQPLPPGQPPNESFALESNQLSSTVNVCTISDEQAKQLADSNLPLYIEYGKNFSIIREGNLTINNGVTLKNFNISGDTTINYENYGNTFYIINSQIEGNLHIRETLNRQNVLMRGPSLTIAGYDYLSNDEVEQADSIVKKDFLVESDNIAAAFHPGEETDYKSDAMNGFGFNTVVLVGDYADADVYRKGSRFIAEGNSRISLDNNRYTGNEPYFIRSALSVPSGTAGNVLALAERYDPEKHKIIPAQNRIFFGEKNRIETKEDYSHGLLMSSMAGGFSHYGDEFHSAANIYLENKGVIKVNGKASAITAYQYRLSSLAGKYHELITPKAFATETSKLVDGVEVFNRSSRKWPVNPDDPHPFPVVSNLQGYKTTYIIPSAVITRDFLQQHDDSFNRYREATEKAEKYIAYAKKYFDPNETVVEIHNSGKLLAPNGYIFSGSEFKDIFASTGGELAGKLVFNNGSDEMSLHNTHVNSLLELNGAEIDGRERELKKKATLAHADYTYSEEDGTESVVYTYVDIPQAVNVLNLDQELTGSSTSTGKVGDSKIVNWDIINIGHNGLANLNLTGDLNDGWDGLAFEDNLRSKILNIGSQGLLSLADNQTEARVSYHVTNAGAIDLSKNPSLSNALIIDGNYVGQEGKLLVNSQWNDPDSQQTDRLLIKGNASGRTIVEAPESIKGNVTLSDKEIKNGHLTNPVVIVEGEDSGSFVGKAMTTNAGEAQLHKSIIDGKSQYHWTLGLKDNEQEIINKPSTAYVQSQAVARELGFMTLGRLNQRLGELTNSSKPQTWLRTRFEDDILNGKNRFATKSQRYLVQIGQDVALWQDTEKLSRLGITFSHSKANTKFFDKYRAENGEVISDKFTTEAKLTALSLGGYFTQRYNNGAYVDFTGQLSHLKFNYLGEAQAKQKGYAIGASVEVGYPIALNAIWDVEPQAQLSYQHIRLSAFSDAQQRQIAKQTSNNLRARLGVRFVANKQLYLGANLHYDLMGNQSKATIGRSYLAEKYGRLITELNFGGKIDLSENVSINIEAYYKKNLSKGHNAAQSNRDPSELGGQARLQVLF